MHFSHSANALSKGNLQQWKTDNDQEI